jgi:hypothetical protein
VKPERKRRRYEVILSEQAEHYKSKLPSHVQNDGELQWLSGMSIKFATNNLATRYWLLAVMSLT